MKGVNGEDVSRWLLLELGKPNVVPRPQLKLGYCDIEHGSSGSWTKRINGKRVTRKLRLKGLKNGRKEGKYIEKTGSTPMKKGMLQ